MKTIINSPDFGIQMGGLQQGRTKKFIVNSKFWPLKIFLFLFRFFQNLSLALDLLK